jgi:hypothetical protein
MARYERFIDLFFEYNKEHHVDFRCVVFDCNAMDHPTFNRGDGELGFNKFLYQHLLSHSRAMPRCSRFWCHHHRRDSRYKLSDIRESLNSKGFHENPRLIDPYKEVSYKSFADAPAIQFADVLIGSIGFAWNKKDGPKSTLAKRISDWAHHPLDRPTPLDKRHFNIWEFDLGIRPREPSAAHEAPTPVQPALSAHEAMS